LSTNIPNISFDQPKVCTIGSLWRRIGALVVDALILYGAGRIVGITFFDALSQLGAWAHLVGFSLALVYFSILDSGIGGGRTIGKRLLRLRVVDAQGGLISWERASIRYTICAIPFFLIGLRYSRDNTPWIVIALIIFAELGVGGALLYFPVFNRRTRQGIHDVAMETYVVESGSHGPIQTKTIWGLHWAVLSSFLFLIAFTALSEGITIGWRQKSGHVSQNLVDEQLIEKLAGVQTAEVRLWTPIQSDGSALGMYLSKKKPATIIVDWTGQMGAREALTDQVAEVILKSDPRAQKQD
jgi:uncharacterized RDD family membrane protein YckC